MTLLSSSQHQTIFLGLLFVWFSFFIVVLTLLMLRSAREVKVTLQKNFANWKRAEHDHAGFCHALAGRLNGRLGTDKLLFPLCCLHSSRRYQIRSLGLGTLLIIFVWGREGQSIVQLMGLVQRGQPYQWLQRTEIGQQELENKRERLKWYDEPCPRSQQLLNFYSIYRRWWCQPINPSSAVWSNRRGACNKELFWGSSFFHVRILHVTHWHERLLDCLRCGPPQHVVQASWFVVCTFESTKTDHKSSKRR